MLKFVSAVCAAVVIASMVVPGVAQAAAACSKPDSASGDWPSYGHDVLNTRNQTKESHIGSGNVAGLKAKWSFASTKEGGTFGAFQSTPVEANGCLFVTSATLGTPTSLVPFSGSPIDTD